MRIDTLRIVQWPLHTRARASYQPIDAAVKVKVTVSRHISAQEYDAVNGEKRYAMVVNAGRETARYFFGAILPPKQWVTIFPFRTTNMSDITS